MILVNKNTKILNFIFNTQVTNAFCLLGKGIQEILSFSLSSFKLSILNCLSQIRSIPFPLSRLVSIGVLLCPLKALSLGWMIVPFLGKENMKFILSFFRPCIFFLRFSYKLFKYKAINKYERE